MLKKVLIANRGEIAVRIIRALREMDIPSVAVYSEADRSARHVRLADEAYCIGPAPSAESYLRQDVIIDTAKQCGAEGIHPGYGFLSENAAFSRACAEAGITFIGPPPAAISAMGEKTESRRRMSDAGVPVVPGTLEALRDADEAVRLGEQIGYPIMLKAACGGGGKGMRIVASPSEMAGAFRDASSEALKSFGDGSMYIEKAILRPRHIEVQILADGHGNVIHLGERECSIQRRHQKVVEESPSPLVDEEMRAAMGETAVRAARAVGYINAGTIEFLVDEERNFYFMEMNTRLQVEHPITEVVTGLDLAREQIRIASGLPLSLSQEDVLLRGSAIECRIYAEDPNNSFLPCPGKVVAVRLPEGPRVRVDSAVYSRGEVSLHYDPMVAKVIAWGHDRRTAIDTMRRALDEFQIVGIVTNKDFLEQIIQHEAFIEGRLSTDFIPKFFGDGQIDVPGPHPVADIVAAIHAFERSRTAEPAGAPSTEISRWRCRDGGWRR